MLRIFNHLSGKHKDLYLLLGCSLLLFVTRIISFREFSLDPDELEWLYDVRKCLIDPRPFVGFDAHTTGPFAIYFLTLIKLVTGFSQLYQLRLVSFFFFILPSLIFVYLMTRNDSKLLGSIAFMVLLCCQNFPQFGHHYDGIFCYNTEYQLLFFTAILMWISRMKTSFYGNLAFTFILFLLPFIKFQAIPITLFFGGFLGIKLCLDQRWKNLYLLLGFYLGLNAIWLGYLYINGLFDSFYFTYISHNLSYMTNSNFGEQSIHPMNFVRRMNEYYSFVYIFLLLFLYLIFSTFPWKIRSFKQLVREPLTESFLYLLASIVTVILSKNDFAHYYIFLFLPLSVFISDLYVQLKNQQEGNGRLLYVVFLIIIGVNFNYNFLGKSIGLIKSKLLHQPENQFEFGKPLQSLANEELTNWLKLHKGKHPASLIVLGWTQAQAIYYVLREDFSTSARSSHVFYLLDSFQNKNWEFFNKEQEIFLDDIKKDEPLFIVDNWGIMDKLKGQKFTDYILSHYDYQISFAENKVYKRKSLIK